MRTLLLSSLVFGLALAGPATSVGLDGLFKSAEGFLDGGGTTSSGDLAGLTDAQIDAGLKQALSLGTERAVAVLGQPGGFLNDPQVRIPLPGVLSSAADGLRAAGQGRYVDDFENAVNRAAESAIPRTLDIVQQTVADMSLQDVRGILTGPDDAATQFLRERAGDDLLAAVMPVVRQATDAAGVTSAYKALVAQGGGMLGGIGGLGGLLGTDSLDLDRYVANETLEGLFVKLAAEEQRIRQDPVARTTDLLETVFSN